VGAGVAGVVNGPGHIVRLTSNSSQQLKGTPMTTFLDTARESLTDAQRELHELLDVELPKVLLTGDREATVEWAQSVAFWAEGVTFWEQRVAFWEGQAAA
jgi:hypothetical protein